jgi:hypothetical protein
MLTLKGLCVTLVVALVLTIGGHALAEAPGDGQLVIRQTPGQAPLGWIEVHGVGAGDFDPHQWKEGPPHALPDYRHPMLAPRWQGTYRNIYAPSVVRLEDRFRLFYGAWDGIDKSNDCIYSAETRGFFEFTERHKVIDNNTLVHVCNVNVLRKPDGEFRMMCTVLPQGEPALNKPAVFTSPDGERWNGFPPPYPATENDIISMEGYDGFANADINGMNVLFYESGLFHIYFCNFKDPGKVFRARSRDGKHFVFEGVALRAPGFVNDLKRFRVGERQWYLMGLHHNGAELYYSLAENPAEFGPQQVLARNLDSEDRYIVSIGWVVDGSRLMGYLYGAGAVPELNRNRIFARWFQKKVVFVDADGGWHEASRALGPDRQLIPWPADKPVAAGHFEVYAEDGVTALIDRFPARIHSGTVFSLICAPYDR